MPNIESARYILKSNAKNTILTNPRKATTIKSVNLSKKTDPTPTPRGILHLSRIYVAFNSSEIRPGKI